MCSHFHLYMDESMHASKNLTEPYDIYKGIHVEEVLVYFLNHRKKTTFINIHVVLLHKHCCRELNMTLQLP